MATWVIEVICVTAYTAVGAALGLAAWARLGRERNLSRVHAWRLAAIMLMWPSALVVAALDRTSPRFRRWFRAYVDGDTS